VRFWFWFWAFLVSLPPPPKKKKSTVYKKFDFVQFFLDFVLFYQILSCFLVFLGNGSSKALQTTKCVLQKAVVSKSFFFLIDKNIKMAVLVVSRVTQYTVHCALLAGGRWCIAVTRDS
jgi:hypothetical protein